MSTATEPAELDISGIDKAELLAALYNRSRPQGLGFLQASPKDMTKEEAAELLQHQTYFDYLHGRVMKVSLKGDSLDPYLYDRDLGCGAAARVVASLKGVAV